MIAGYLPNPLEIDMNKLNRSPCPVACTLDILGDKWTLLIIRDLACGKSQFKDFSRSPERIATNILTDRLNRLLAHGLIERFATQGPSNPAGESTRDGYRLTSKGLTLQPIMKALADWGLANIEGTQAHFKPKWRAVPTHLSVQN